MVDVLIISETKLDYPLPVGQFKIPGYAFPFWLDRNQFGGGILVSIRKDIPSKLLTSDLSLETLFIEIKPRKKKWLLCCTYYLNRNNISKHLCILRRNLDLFSAE